MKQQFNRTILYDDNCYICRSMAKKARKLLLSPGVMFTPSQKYDSISDDRNIDPDTLSKSIVYINDGKVHTGAEAIAGIIKQMPGGYKIPGYIISIPGIKQLFGLCYGIFARYRHSISGLITGSRPPRDP